MIKTQPEQFKKFHELLMASADIKFIPHYFPVKAEDKDPDALAIFKRSTSSCSCGGKWIRKHLKANSVQYLNEIKIKTDKNPKGKWKCEKCNTARSSWKLSYARLTFEEAYQRLKEGGNVGIGAMHDDKLVLIDIDKAEFTNQMPDTLTIISRKRTGKHGYAWTDEEKFNLPTDNGEIRACDEYVLAVGSFVPVKEPDETIKDDINLGVYTIEKDIPPQKISLTKDLPKFFMDALKEEKVVDVQTLNSKKEAFKKNTIRLNEKCSAIFDLKISDIINYEWDARNPHPLHESDTGANFSISDDEETAGILCTCWRHLVTLNALQFLAVKGGYCSCEEAGTPHEKSKATGSKSRDDGIIFYAWLEAKKMKLIPEDDPIPTRALIFIAKKHKLIPQEEQVELLPRKTYNQALKIVEDEY